MRSTQAHGLFLLEDKNKGRGVFTSDEIAKESIIEICPVIVIPSKELPVIHKTSLHDYYFLWGKNRDAGAIALGYGSLYNHSDNPNAFFEIDLPNIQIRIIALSGILPGEEITISYTDQNYRNVELWFDPQQ